MTIGTRFITRGFRVLGFRVSQNGGYPIAGPHKKG